MGTGKLILTGKIGVGKTVVGVVRVLGKGQIPLAKITSGDIIVTERTDPPDTEGMKKAAGIITDLGGATSHTAITCKLFNIPGVIATVGGTEGLEATSVLKNGQKVVVDGTTGRVFEYVDDAPPTTMSSLAAKMAALVAAKGMKLNPDFLKKI
jgi:pyruvate,water dikinase